MKKKNTTPNMPASQVDGQSKAKKALNIALPILIASGLLVGAYVIIFSNESTASPSATPSNPSNPSQMIHFARKAKTLDDLLAMSAEQLSDVDIAEMNLLCAVGLPGATNLDIDKLLTILDQWAQRVRDETSRYMYKFRQNPAGYNNSEGYFRMLTLVTVLQQDFGVRYNPQRIRQPDFTNARDLFLHGMVGDDNGGTCVSMPVLYVAVGRRLGYPLKLVLAKAHVFARWEIEDVKERFNIEGTNEGLDTPEDDYYKTWPLRMTTGDLRSGRYLCSLSQAEELAQFLAARGHCLLDTGKPEQAFNTYDAAAKFSPNDPALRSWRDQAARKWNATK